MDYNPYAPPAASVGDLVTTGTLYSPRQIFTASFLGGPIAAAWLIHRNFMTLGQARRGLRTLWLGLAATLTVLIASFYLPKRFPTAALPIAYSFAIYQYALFVFKAAYTEHRTAGGRIGSWWSVGGVSLLAVLIVLGAATAIAFAVPSLLSDR